MDPDGREDEYGNNEWDIIAEKYNSIRDKHTTEHKYDCTGKNMGDSQFVNQMELVKAYANSHLGFNVVFMGDGNKSYTVGHEHAGLLIVNMDDTVDYYDSSRGNPEQSDVFICSGF